MDTARNKKCEEILNSAHHDFERKLAVYAFLKTHNLETSKDLVQDTFIKTWKYLVKGGDIIKMKAFLYHVLNNLIVDEYRKHKISSLDVLSDKGYELGVDDSEKLFDSIDGKALIFLINDLPPKYKKVINLKYVQSLSLEEISFVLGKTKNSVAVIAHRGLEKLKIIYEANMSAKNIRHVK